MPRRSESSKPRRFAVKTPIGRIWGPAGFSLWLALAGLPNQASGQNPILDSPSRPAVGGIPTERMPKDLELRFDTSALSDEVDRATRGVEERVGRRMYAEAVEVLDALDREELTSIDAVAVDQAYAYVHASSGSLADAAISYRRALERGDLDPGIETLLRRDLAQVLLADGRSEEALKLLTLSEPPDPADVELRSRALAASGEFERALAAARASVSQSLESDVARLQWLTSLLVQAGENDEAAVYATELVAGWPTRQHHLQLAAIQGRAGRGAAALATLRSAYEAGLLDRDAELRLLARMSLAADPEFAVDVIEEGMRSATVRPDPEAWLLLGEAQAAAGRLEAAVDPLRRAAAGSDHGEAYRRLGEVLAALERWGEARVALESALARDDLREAGPALLTLGIAQYHLEERRAAARNFERARGHDRTRADADRWISRLGGRSVN